MNNAPAFQLYPADWLSDSRLMALPSKEMGMLFLLSLVMWREDGLAIEDDYDYNVCATITRTDMDDFQKTWEFSLSRIFEKMPNGKWHLPLLVREKDKQLQRNTAKSEAGKAGAEKRWQNHKFAIDSKMADPFSANGRPIADGIANDSFSSSTSTSTSIIKNPPTPLKNSKKKVLVTLPDEMPPNVEGARTDLLDFLDYRNKIKKEPMSELALKRLINELSKHSTETIKESISHAIISGWNGVFPRSKSQSLPFAAPENKMEKNMRIIRESVERANERERQPETKFVRLENEN